MFLCLSEPVKLESYASAFEISVGKTHMVVGLDLLVLQQTVLILGAFRFAATLLEILTLGK